MEQHGYNLHIYGAELSHLYITIKLYLQLFTPVIDC